MFPINLTNEDIECYLTIKKSFVINLYKGKTDKVIYGNEIPDVIIAVMPVIICNSITSLDYILASKHLEFCTFYSFDCYNLCISYVTNVKC